METDPCFTAFGICLPRAAYENITSIDMFQKTTFFKASELPHVPEKCLT